MNRWRSKTFHLQYCWNANFTSGTKQNKSAQSEFWTITKKYQLKKKKKDLYVIFTCQQVKRVNWWDASVRATTNGKFCVERFPQISVLQMVDLSHTWRLSMFSNLVSCGRVTNNSLNSFYFLWVGGMIVFVTLGHRKASKISVVSSVSS